MNPRLVAEGVDALTWPKEQFDHRGHLAAGAWWSHLHGVDALEHARMAIRRFNEVTGGVNTDTEGYHETLTVYYLAVISGLVSDSTPDSTWFEANAADVLLERSAPLRFWSEEVLMSVEARRSWVEPDQRRLPEEVRAQIVRLLGSEPDCMPAPVVRIPDSR